MGIDLEKFNVQETKTSRMTSAKTVEAEESEVPTSSGPSLPNQLTTETEWARQGTSFIPATRADKSPKLPKEGDAVIA